MEKVEKTKGQKDVYVCKLSKLRDWTRRRDTFKNLKIESTNIANNPKESKMQ